MEHSTQKKEKENYFYQTKRKKDHYFLSIFF